MEWTREAVNQFLANGLAEKLASVRDQFAVPLTSLSNLDEDPAFLNFSAAADTRSLQCSGPEGDLLQAYQQLLGALFRNEAGAPRSLGEMLSEASSMRVFFTLGGATKDLVLPRGTTLEKARSAVGWLFDRDPEHLDLGQGASTRVLVAGETVPVAVSASAFPVSLDLFQSAKSMLPDASVPRVAVPSAEPSFAFPRPDKPDHIVVLMVVGLSCALNDWRSRTVFSWRIARLITFWERFRSLGHRNIHSGTAAAT